ncbi:unnamed protein product [Allacma fusca]|uniref:Uncharacterized protein n=1 Tax=Allacma fusca TaxID=39272 RepID=A0A8J2K757_9HEXA|nr:unnamed protein product [Allacma fusca]
MRTIEKPLLLKNHDMTETQGPEGVSQRSSGTAVPNPSLTNGPHCILEGLHLQLCSPLMVRLDREGSRKHPFSFNARNLVFLELSHLTPSPQLFLFCPQQSFKSKCTSRPTQV